MKRVFAPFLLCAAVALATAPAVPAADGVERAPERLWDEFPLEPNATPSQAAAPRPSRPRIVRVRDDGGTSGRTIVALMLAAACLGAVTAYATRRRLPRDGWRGAPRPAAASPSRAPVAVPAPRRKPPPVKRPESCRIELRSRWIKSCFLAVPRDGGPELARSPYFRAQRGDAKEQSGARQALQALVDELTTAGWRQTGAGSMPWDLRFQRMGDGRRTGRAARSIPRRR
jgi:hypothetical protein